MNKLLAVSGGIDSMILLDIFKSDPSVMVAHFDHGTRSSSFDDLNFVRQKAKEYNIPFFSESKNLGSNVPESTARNARYHFLRTVARENNAKIYTAHHADDLLESIAINLHRGTGWRGLSPMSNPDISRPFIEVNLLPSKARRYFNTQIITKSHILKYASDYQISFRQDPTNEEDYYLRNRIRRSMKFLNSITKSQLLELFFNQCQLSTQISDLAEEIVRKLTILPATEYYKKSKASKKTSRISPLPDSNPAIYNRNLISSMNDIVALEIIYRILKCQNISATRPKMLELLHAIRTYSPHKYFNLPGNYLVKITKDQIIFHDNLG